MMMARALRMHDDGRMSNCPSPRRRLCLALLLAGPLRGRAAGMRIAFDEGSPPTMYRDPRGLAAGLYPGLVGGALQQAGLAAGLEAMPFKRLLAGLERGELAAGGVIRTEARLRFARYSQPYYDEALLLVVPAAREPLPRGLAELRGQRIGLIRGWSYGAPVDGWLASGQLRAEAVASDRQNLEKLRRERLDAVLISRPGWAAQCLREPAYAAAFREALVLAHNPIHLALPLAWPEGEAWLRRFDAAMRGLQQQGRTQALASEALGIAATLR